MGLFKVAKETVQGVLADQWLEVYEPYNMGDQTVFTSGVRTRKGQNTKGTDNVVSNGSLIHVYENQFMMLVDGGKIVDYTAEAGYYKVDNSAAPSLFNGDFLDPAIDPAMDSAVDSVMDSLKDAWERFKFAGETPREQKVYFINLQEIKGIKFGTRNPINYFDNFYNAELFIRAHGTYSIKIINPIQFYAEAIPKNRDHVEITDINEQYISEFLQALQTSINQMSADGIRISHVTSKAMELGKYMASVLDEEWNKMRGMEIQSVGIASVSYDEESQKLINMRNEGAMLSDEKIARGYMVGNMARGMEAAGSNEGGSMNGFLGMGMSMNMGGSILGQMPVGNNAQTQPNTPQAAAPANADAWTCECGQVNTGKFCPECGKPAPVKNWTCECGQVNTGKFCSECGKPRA